jgi:small-conductance mechanosensitive channel
MAGELSQLFSVDQSLGFYGLLQNDIIRSLLVILCSVIIAILIKSFSVIIIKKIIKDNEVLKQDLERKLAVPLFFSVITVGLFFAARTISYLSSFSVWITRFFFAVFALIAAYILSLAFTLIVSNWFKVHRKYEHAPKIISKIISFIIFIIAIVTILGFYGIEITPIIATLGIGGLAIGLALQPTFTNLFAGIHIISDKPIEVGDFVEIDNGTIKGYVQDIGWRSTRIKKLSGVLIVVPNSKLAESVIVNNTTGSENKFTVLVNLGVSYSSNLKKVEKVTIEVAKKIQEDVKGAVSDFNPFIRYNEFDDSNINFTVIMKAQKYADQYIIKHEFIKALKEKFDKEKIEISFPVRKIVYDKKRR